MDGSVVSLLRYLVASKFVSLDVCMLEVCELEIRELEVCM